MKSGLEIDPENSDLIGEAVKPSLETDDQVRYSISTEPYFEVQAETDTLGRLRGVTDNALRLSLLSNKILQR